MNRIVKLILLVSMLTILSCGTSDEKNDTVFKGIMIDCSRLIEQHDYYFRLVDFMADWGMNTLILHFSDDHGLSIKLPGYEQLAAENAFTVDEIKNLVRHARQRGIDIIPELEVFGHTRYITDHPDFQHLGLREHDDQLAFNAIDPLHPETQKLLEDLIEAVVTVFPSEYIHLGCDEVDLEGLPDHLDEKMVWVDHVNKMVGIARDHGKTAMIWNDHVRKDSLIAANLDKDVILAEWNYDPDYKPTSLPRLQKAGFEKIIMAPSLACYRLRVLPSEPGIRNTSAMIPSLRSGDAMGLINTIWLPQRYLQNTMWYGIAYTAFMLESDDLTNLRGFHQSFSARVWGIELTEDLHNLLVDWNTLHLHRSFYIKAARGDYTWSEEQIEVLKGVRDKARGLLKDTPVLQPIQNQDVFETMILSVSVMEVISESLLILGQEEKEMAVAPSTLEKLGAVIEAVDSDWDSGRFPDDPQKYEPKFSNIAHSHLLVVLKQIESDLKALPG